MRQILIYLSACTLLLTSVPAFANPVSDNSDVIVLPNCSLKLSIATTASKETIWQLWSDVENWKQFDTILEYSYLVDNAEFKQAAIGYLKAEGAPKTKFELIAVNEGVSFIEELKVPLYQTIKLQRYFEEDSNGFTIFTHEVNFRGGLRHIYYALLAGTFKKELRHVMGNLKKVAERIEAEKKIASEFE